MIKKIHHIWLFCLVLPVVLLTANKGYGQDSCPEGYPVNCIYWCCPQDYPVCGDNHLECFSSGTPGTTTVTQSSTSTVPAGGTTTVPDGTATTTVSQYCANDPDGPVECLDLPNQKYWCCPESSPVCGEGDTYGMCLQGGGGTTSTAPAASTTTVSGGTTTTSVSQYCVNDPDGPVECLDLPNQKYWCCPESSPVCGNYECLPSGGAETTSVPEGGGTTSTVPAGGGTNTDFITGINLKGENAPQTQSSGFLPGTSPSKVKPLLLREDGRPIPLWYEKYYPPIDPESLKKTREILENKKKAPMAQQIKPYTGEQKSFWVKDDKDNAWRQVSATNLKTSSYSYIFVDDSLSIPDESLELYANEFDVMYGKVLSPNIGDFADRDGNGKITILLYDMNDSGSINMYMGGYFWSKDYLEDSVTKTQGVRSNEMDIIYIRGDEPTGWEQMGEDFYAYNLTTLVHECQHLIQFGILVWDQGNSGNYADIWINEMMSMATETMYFKEKLSEDSSFIHPSMEGNGYLTDRIAYYSRDPNNSIRNGHGLTYWDYKGDVLSNYVLSYLMGQYLSIHSSTGQAIFKNILNYMIANGPHDYQAVAATASQSISGIASWEDLLKSFSIGNMANQTEGLYGYLGAFTLTAHGPTLNKANINNGGAVYRNIQGDYNPPSGTGPDIRFYDANGNLIPSTVGSGCVASMLLGDNSEESNVLRDFRDKILLSSETGKNIVNLYYWYAEEINSIVMKNPEIRSMAKKLLLGMVKILRNDTVKSFMKNGVNAIIEM